MDRVKEERSFMNVECIKRKTNYKYEVYKKINHGYRNGIKTLLFLMADRLKKVFIKKQSDEWYFNKC